MSRRALYPLLIVSLAAMTYANVLYGPFIYDDHTIIEGSEFLKLPVSPWKAFGLDFFNLMNRVSSSGYYRPLPVLAYKLLADTVGLVPLAYHLLNLLIHCLCSALVYALARVWLGSERVGLWAGLLFAVHPIHTEAVDWISSTGDLLACLWGLIALCLWRRPRGAWTGPVALFLAMLCKENALLLGVVAAAAAWLARRSSRLQNPPGAASPQAVALGTALALATYLGLRLGYAGVGFHGAATAGDQLGIRVLRSAELFIGYLGLMLWPHPLNLQRWATLARSPQPILLVIAWALSVGYLGLTVYWVRRRSDLSLCLLFIAVTLAPVLNLLALPHPLAERSAYLPSVGFCLLAGLALAGLARPARLLLGGLLLLVGSYLTTTRGLDWIDEVRLWQQTVAVAPHSLDAHLVLAQVYLGQGSLGIASQHFGALIEAAPGDSAGYLGLAEVYRRQGRLTEATVVLQTALTRGAQPRSGLQTSLARLWLDLHRESEAIPLFEAALPDPEARFHLSVALAHQGRLRDAQQQLEALLKTQSDHYRARHNLLILYRQGADQARAAGDRVGEREQLEGFLRLAEPDQAERAELEARLRTIR